MRMTSSRLPGILFIVFLMLTGFKLYAQDGTIKPDTYNHLQLVRKLYSSPVKTPQLVTDYFFDSVISSMQEKISGTIKKEGKIASTTASVDESSITVNTNLINKSGFNLQLSAGGSATDSFVNIFSKGKYGKTLTGGFVFNFFPATNSGNFFAGSKERLWNLLKLQDRCFVTRDSETVSKAYKGLIDDLYTTYSTCKKFLCGTATIVNDIKLITDGEIDCKTCTIEKLTGFYQQLNQFSSYFPDDFDSSDCTKLSAFVNWLHNHKEEVAKDRMYNANLVVLDSLQRTAAWTYFSYHWFTGSIKLNQSIYPLFDINSKEDLYKKDFHDYYISASFAYNLMWVNKLRSKTIWLSPTLKFQNSRVFEEDSLKQFQRQDRFIINNDTLQMIRPVSFYLAKASRKNSFTFEIPAVLFNTERNFGYDVAFGFKFSNKLDDLYSRFGLYIPITVDEENTVTVEPLIKVSNINGAGIKTFVKDMLSFGFNISVSLPKFLK